MDSGPLPWHLFRLLCAEGEAFKFPGLARQSSERLAIVGPLSSGLIRIYTRNALPRHPVLLLEATEIGSF